jgi:protein tyrosine/serine phosphatase
MHWRAVVGLSLCLVGLPATVQGYEFGLFRVDAGLFRSRAPRWRSEFAQLQQAGVRTILDLRAFRPLAARREARLAAAYGLVYSRYSFSTLPRALANTEDVYQRLLRTQDYPLLVHCQHNRDRTSLLIGLYRVRQQGWPLQAAYDEMLRFGLRSRFAGIHRYFWENPYGTK